jgi:hypothetical protein
LNRSVAIVLVFAGLGVVAGSLYPIKLVITAFQRASQAAQAKKETVPSSTAQEAIRAPLALAPAKPASASTEITQPAPEAETRFVLLNPGSAEPATAPQEQQPVVTTPTERLSPAKRLVSRQQPVQSATNGDLNVLVVVRRRGPPYDTRVLHGRIRDGRLIVNARGLTIH